MWTRQEQGNRSLTERRPHVTDRVFPLPSRRERDEMEIDVDKADVPLYCKDTLLSDVTHHVNDVMRRTNGIVKDRHVFRLTGT